MGIELTLMHTQKDKTATDVKRERAKDICAVICTHDHPDLLRRALTSLMNQTVIPDDILVVDNAPSGPAVKTVVQNEFPDVRYVEEPIAGLDFARNRALSETSKEVIAFMDDDVVAGISWISAIQSVFLESKQIAICTGKVSAYSVATAGAQLFEANGGFARGNTRIHLPEDRKRPIHGLQPPLIAWSISIGSGCSFAVRRETIIKLGGFDEALDMGAALAGGGDLDMLWRAIDSGYEVIYEPSVEARHEHRSDYNDSVHQIIEHNRSLIAMLTKVIVYGCHTGRAGVVAFLIWRLMKPGIRLIRRFAGQDPLPAKVLLRLWWNCWRGLIAYVFARRLAKKRRIVSYV